MASILGARPEHFISILTIIQVPIQLVLKADQPTLPFPILLFVRCRTRDPGSEAIYPKTHSKLVLEVAVEIIFNDQIQGKKKKLQIAISFL